MEYYSAKESSEYSLYLSKIRELVELQEKPVEQKELDPKEIEKI